MVLLLLTMIVAINVVSLKVTVRELIVSLLGQDSLDKTTKHYFMKQFFGTLLKNFNGRTRDLPNKKL